MPPRYPPNPYRVTLDFDPVTSDALTQAAKAAGSTRHRLAYEFVQQGLGLSQTSAPPPVAETDDPFATAMRRGLDAITRPTARGG